MSHRHLADATNALRVLDESLPLEERTPAELTAYADAKTRLAIAYSLQTITKAVTRLAQTLGHDERAER